jgi:hypothetical protein
MLPMSTLGRSGRSGSLPLALQVPAGQLPDSRRQLAYRASGPAEQSLRAQRKGPPGLRKGGQELGHCGPHENLRRACGERVARIFGAHVHPKPHLGHMRPRRPLEHKDLAPDASPRAPQHRCARKCSQLDLLLANSLRFRALSAQKRKQSRVRHENWLHICSHFAVDERSHFAVDERSHFAVDERSHFAVDERSHFAVGQRASVQ